MKYSTIYFTAIILLFSSCKKYLDVNQNPNAGETPPVNGLLAGTTYATSYNVYYTSNITSYYVQYLASPNAGSDIDIYNTIGTTSVWDNVYNTLTDLYDMRRFSKASGLTSYTGVAEILTAINLNMASNLFGDMPYSQAFTGVENLTPAFDDAHSLFDTAMALLNDGIALLQLDGAATQFTSTSSDFIHAGSPSAWMKTAHAMKARMMTQLSKTADYNAADILNELSLAYTSNDDDAQLTSYEVRNPWADVAIANAGLDLDGWLSSYFVNAANGTTYGAFDPRLPLITDTTQFGDYRGTPNGKGRIGTGTEQEECYLSVGGWYSDDNSPLQIITYAECLFMKAEAELRSGQAENAYADYLAGITANMQKMGISDDAIQAYTSNASVAVGASALTVQTILKEKYMACFLSPVTWDDMRRTDYNYEGFSLPVGAVLSTFIRRVNYPADEISSNGQNVPDVTLDQKLWWDQ